MYVPAHFELADTQAMHTLMTGNPFGTLFTHGRSGMDANHIPFELDAGTGEHGMLKAHVARANPVWQDVANGDEVMVVFRNGDAYISPNWYPSKHEAHKQVPTWNYQVVHAHGRITIHDDERYVRGVVVRLTRHHEASQPRPWKMSDAPADFIDTLLKSIVGIEIEITRLQGKRKLGQHKDERDIRGPGEALMANGSTVIGQAMLDVADAKAQQ